MIKDNQNSLNKLHIVIDAVLIIAAYCLTYPLRFYLLPYLSPFTLEDGEHFLSFSRYMENIVLLVPGYLILYNMCGLYRPKRGHSRLYELRNLVEANIMGIFYFAFLIYIEKEFDISRWFYIIFAFMNLLFGAAFRLMLAQLLGAVRKRGKNIKHVLMVGYSRAAEGFIDRITGNPNWGYSIFGILDDHMAVGTRYKKVEVIGEVIELQNIIESNDFDEIVISLGIQEYAKLEGIVNICEKSGLHTKFVPDYNNMVSTVPYIEDLYGLPVINIRNVPLSNTINMFFKRAMDLVIGILALLIFSIPMLVVAILIKCTSRGPIIYSQVRVGKHGREFNMYKFRSMHIQNPNQEKTKWTTKGDPRITPVGRFIRKTSLDELPQLFNVIKGNMSLVGPRPERPQFVEKFREEIPRYMIKHQVRPGMTGWAQISGYRGDTSIRRRIDHDLYYIENWSIWLDFKILILTLFKGFINRNAY